MDDLRRLYEHQTMMAFGIYSFLDNLLTQIPTRSTASSGSEDLPAAAPRITGIPLSLRNSELAESLLELNRPESFQDRRERMRLLPRMSTLSTGGVSAPGRTDEQHAVDSARRSASSDSDENSGLPEPVLTPPKLDVTPGGYPEEIFIYLSEREKEDYICSVCYCVLKEAYQCKNEHRFCYGCIYTWSTGSSVGHDGCPVCRCDGLYAKNFDVIEKIDRKRARCVDPGCNWMGFLGDYTSHEHRKYTPRELDVLISSTYRQDPRLAALETDVQNDGELSVADEVPATVRLEAQSIESLPNAGTPLDVDVEQPIVQRADEITPLPSLRRRSRRSPASGTHGGLLAPPRTSQRRNSVTPQPRARSRQSSTASNGRTRPPTFPRQSPLQTNDTRRTGRVRASSRQGSNPRNTPTSVAQERSESNPVGVTTDVRGESRLLPLRTTCGSEIRNSPVTTPARSPQPVLLAESVNTSGTNSMLGRCSVQEYIPEDSFLNQNIDSVEGNLSLPAISRNVPLISQHVSQSYQETEGPVDGSQMDGRIRQTPGIRSSRPLEFRRLVPRRNHRVTEQLRETREQLAAMLRLMTLELEERRQQVLAAAMATMNRRRLLRTVTDHPPNQNTAEHDSSPDLSPRSPERQNHNLQSSLNTLRNYPAPERTASRFPRPQPLHRLTSRLMEEQLRCEEPTSRPYRPQHQRHPSDETLESSESASEGQANAACVPRLLSRVRLRPEQQPHLRAPSVVVVTGRRTLGQLLAEMRYPRAQVNQWSSEEEDDEEDEDDGIDSDEDLL